MSIQHLRPIRRGDIYRADLMPVIGSEQGGSRPVLVIQNDVGNQHSPTIIAAIITGQIKSWYLPTHILLTAVGCGLPQSSMVMLEQIRTLDRRRLQGYLGHIAATKMREVDIALRISIGLDNTYNLKEEALP